VLRTYVNDVQQGFGRNVMIELSCFQSSKSDHFTATQHDVDGESHSAIDNSRGSSMENSVLSLLLMLTMRSSSQHWVTHS
jgi:hypothetical protein